MEKYYRFAGVDLTVDLPENSMYDNERLLAAFRVEAVFDPEVFRFELTEAVDPPHGENLVSYPGLHVYRDGACTMRYFGTLAQNLQHAYIRIEEYGKQHHVQICTTNHSGVVHVKTVLNSLDVAHLVTRAGGVIFHSSYIEYDGKAILFTAPSGTGKSTQAELWRSLRGARIINGDRSAIRFEDGVLCAMGIPFAGSSTYCENRTLPLAAIVYLAQAPETTIRKVRGAEAFRRIWEGCTVNTWDRTDVDLASETVMKIASSVPVYYLACTPDESAVIALEQFLREKV